MRLASARTATIEEDAAYSLIGIFKSDIIPRYGEGGDALGHLLEGIVAHLGAVTVLAWTGSSSSYNSCLPSSLAPYDRTLRAPPAVDADETTSRTTQLSTALSTDDALEIYGRLMDLASPRFANRRLQLPCIVFQVRSLVVRDWGDRWNDYRTEVSKLGTVDFRTADRLPLAEPWRCVIVHPWIGDVLGPDDGGVGVDAAALKMKPEVGSAPDVDVDTGSEEEEWWDAASSLDSFPDGGQAHASPTNDRPSPAVVQCPAAVPAIG